MSETDGAFLTGRLLIAMPAIGDPRFERTVIYMCSHDEASALGLIVNRPASVDPGDLLRRLDISPGPALRRIPVVVGGPVERSRGFVLHSSDWRSPGATMEVTPQTSMTASVDVLRALAAGTGPARAVLALGYSGWGPGQLEREIRANGWLIGEPEEDIVFGPDLAGKWRAALARLGIDHRMLSAGGGQA